MKGNEFIKTLVTLSFLLLSLESYATVSVASGDEALSGNAKVTVRKDFSKIDLRDVRVYTNGKWTKNANFIDAYDREGRRLEAADLKVTSNVDTRIPGIYEVRYDYQNRTAFALVTVEDSPSQKKRAKTILTQEKHRGTPLVLNKELFESVSEPEKLTSGNNNPSSYDVTAYYLSGTLLFGQRRNDRC